MKILVTGGAGFLGSHLCEAFISQGHSVVCVDNLISGSLTNIQHLLSDSKFQFINEDVSNRFKVNEGVDHILHFASPASPIDYYKFPIETLKTGSLGTFNVLDLAREKKATFLLASTSEVYGDPSQNPQKEDYWGNVNPMGPRSVYDEAKRFSEALTMAYHRRYGIDTKIARIFNTYGPGMRSGDGRAIPALVTQALNNKALTIFGDDSQTRSFCYVSDLIEGINKLMLSDISWPINLGNSEEFTILELAQKILEFTGAKSRLIFEPLPENDPKQRRPDLSNALKDLGWSPSVDLNQGLAETIKWFRKSAN